MKKPRQHVFAQKRQGYLPMPAEMLPAPFPRADRVKLALGGGVLAAAFVWAYWPSLGALVDAWDHVPDYSHGYLVAPLAVFFLWTRRDLFPGLASGWSWPGLVLILVSAGFRVQSVRIGFDALDGWSMLLWIAGAVWLLGGARFAWWAAPSIAFLLFMIPLPYSVEHGLHDPLQRVVTQMSCWVLQCLGQPALAEANVVQIGDMPLEVAEACSGLRIFMGIVALAFAYVIVVRPPWWEKALLLASVVPIALVANCTRIVATGLLLQAIAGPAGAQRLAGWHLTPEAARHWIHDGGGWVMIPLAAVLFGLFLWYLRKLVPEVETVNVGAVLHRERNQPGV